MDLIISFAIGFWLGTMYATYRLRSVLRTMAKDRGIDIPDKEKLDKKEIPVLITEKHGDMLYLFEHETDNFMCQGDTLEELQKKLSEYKNINIALVLHNTKMLWFVNGEIVEQLDES